VRGTIAAPVDELTVIRPEVLGNFEFALRDKHAPESSRGPWPQYRRRLKSWVVSLRGAKNVCQAGEQPHHDGDYHDCNKSRMTIATLYRPGTFGGS